MCQFAPRVRRDPALLVALMLGLCLSVTAPLGAVVINEIHYNPVQGQSLEFIELHNPAAEAVSLADWRFDSGVTFLFPAEAVIEAGGYVVVAKDREFFAGFYRLPEASVFGNFAGGLDNNGERVRLIDAEGEVVDELRYGSLKPWDPYANGIGPSLQRICHMYVSDTATNWRARLDDEPTPLAENVQVACPPPAPPTPPIVISEIHYHPRSDQDETEEFVELMNVSDAPVNLRGYSFSQGMQFTFEDDYVLQPGMQVAVCRNRENMVATYSVRNAVGDFLGALSNDGERITLVDDSGVVVDTVRYDETGDWPVSPDGLGFSLEKVVPEAESDDPGSWKQASFGKLNEWRSISVSRSHVSSRSKLSIYMADAGEALIDNIVVEPLGQPGVNLVPNGSFDTGVETWEIVGNHDGSTWAEGAGPDGSGALRVVSTGRGTSSTNGVNIDLDPGLERNGDYTLSFDFALISGSQVLTVKMSGGTLTRGLYFRSGEGSAFSPGEPNGVSEDHRYPHVSVIRRTPREPGSEDPVWITSWVRGDAQVARVSLTYQADGGEEVTLPMLDDGLNEDGAAGDGVHGVDIPPLPHNTIVTFTIRAEDVTGLVTISPPENDPSVVHGYYVNDNRPDSPLPIMTILYNHRSAARARDVIRALPNNCGSGAYLPAAFAYRGDLYPNTGIRRRGGSVCSAFKPYLKFRFNKGRHFQNQRRINLQSLWTDKGLVRDFLAWELFEDLGHPGCKEEFIRLHGNGQFFGLYATLEHLDHKYLERNGLDGNGSLYKATASREEANGTYEKKTNLTEGFDDIRTFLTDMHATPRAGLVDFFSQNVNGDRLIDYQLAQTLINNSDYPHKNHYLYHDPNTDKWSVLPWDLDLSFGKRWNGQFSGVYHDLMHNPGNNPWYTTSVDGGLGNHLLDKFFSQAGTWFRRSYLVRLWIAIQEKYTIPYYEERIGQLRDLLLEEQAEDIALWGRTPASADDPRAPAEFLPNLDRIMQHITLRRSYLLNYLRSRHDVTSAERLKITEVNYNPDGTTEDLEFLELWNPTDAVIELGGWSIEGFGFDFPAGSRVEAGEVIIVAKNPLAFRSRYGVSVQVLGPAVGNLDNNGETLRVKDAGPGYPATVDLLKYGTDGDWPIQADGFGYTLELTDVSANRDNDMGRYWKASSETGGTPGIVPGVTSVAYFRRGDVDGDGSNTILDAIKMVQYLFSSTFDPPCVASLDVDGNGEVEVTDPIFFLEYTFGLTDLRIPSPGPGECSLAPAGSCDHSTCEP